MLINGDIGRLNKVEDSETGDESVVYRDGVCYRKDAVDGVTEAQLAERTYSNTVIVKQASDLTNIDSTKNYMIDGFVDMGSQTIIVPEGGISISGLNGARDTAILFSSVDNHTFFASPIGGYSGGGVLESCTIDATGVGTVVWDCDNDGNSGAWDVTGVNFGRFGSTLGLGQLTDYRQLLFDGIGLIFTADGLTFNGTWTGIRATTSIAVGWPNATLFKAGTGFTIDNFLSDFNFLSVDEFAVFCDFTEAQINSDLAFGLSKFRTTATNPLPNLPADSNKTLYESCRGILNTFGGGSWEVATTATTPLTQNVPTKILGTTTYSGLSHFTGANSNEFVHDITESEDYKVTGTIIIDGTPNNQYNVTIRRWNNATSSYEDVREFQRVISNVLGGLDVAFFDISCNVRLENRLDRVEAWLTNVSSGGDGTMIIGSYLDIDVRK